MAPPAGHVRVQLPRENFFTFRSGSVDNASVSMRRHASALLVCAAAACLMVQRNGPNAAGHFRCGAEVRSHTRRLLWRCAKMAAIVRPLPGLAVANCARQ